MTAAALSALPPLNPTIHRPTMKLQGSLPKGLSHDDFHRWHTRESYGRCNHSRRTYCPSPFKFRLAPPTRSTWQGCDANVFGDKAREKRPGSPHRWVVALQDDSGRCRDDGKAAGRLRLRRFGPKGAQCSIATRDHRRSNTSVVNASSSFTALREHHPDDRDQDEAAAAAVAAADAVPVDPPTTGSYKWIGRDLEAQLRDHDPRSAAPRGERRRPDGAAAVKIIFSDIDGSLIHYSQGHDDDSTQRRDGDNKILELPPSATGMRGTISSRTLAACRDLRIEEGVKLVLITGARTSTLLNRLPFLPKADARAMGLLEPVSAASVQGVGSSAGDERQHCVAAGPM
eukprot:CAMPEP_0172580246 /NCGR_PEP_ID=MMETSP1067-20121228/139656_1 /TAXON_ID=265564 ORGANISM="Thalassiosira punctigera, Strain Tpunct2005C2" /NCGR_SAMPLE_ID=MMETSP1067 /ASSEMBLY_ACC=CAM_ASM_000444 /LENGTH=342 /DNA_ID=CAMNT_0013372983 /DNA_START=801 /DNA_END=1829 /DNA_ORIENTATION=+